MSIEAPRSERSIPLLTGLRKLFSRPQKVEQSNDGNDPQSILEGVGFLARMRGDNVSRKEFLERVKVDFAISRIYYPGAEYDQQLEEPFGEETVFPLDQYREDIHSSVRNFVQGDMKHSPFLNEVFDAVFLHDIGANKEELTDILRTLRPNGIVIHSYSDCCDEDLYLLEEHPQLMLLKGPYYNEIFRVFRKGEATTLANGILPNPKEGG